MKLDLLDIRKKLLTHNLGPVEQVTRRAACIFVPIVLTELPFIRKINKKLWVFSSNIKIILRKSYMCQYEIGSDKYNKN